MSAAPVVIQRTLAPEDQARADFYAILGRLFAAPPDAELLHLLAQSERLPETDANPVTRSWNQLLDASGVMPADAAAQEYTELFIGVGRSEINLHGSHWLTGFMSEKPLAELRGELARMGLARLGASVTLEDHVAALCETMRIMISGHGERRPATVEAQRNFFQKQLLPWIFDCCSAIEKSSLANYYRRVAELCVVFMTLERDSLAME